MKITTDRIVQDGVVKIIMESKYAKMTEDELTDGDRAEIEMMHDYVRKVDQGNIDFTANVKIGAGGPEVTEDATDGSSVVEVSLGKLPRKQFVVDEKLHIEFSVSADRLPESAVNAVLDTREKVAKAMTRVYSYKMKAAMKELLDKSRDERDGFETIEEDDV